MARAQLRAAPFFQGPAARPGKRGPWDMAWQNVELATILQEVGSRQAPEQDLCLVVGGTATWLVEAGGRDAAKIPWLTCTRARDEAEKKHGKYWVAGYRVV